jgi:hypothetical protein
VKLELFLNKSRVVGTDWGTVNVRPPEVTHFSDGMVHDDAALFPMSCSSSSSSIVWVLSESGSSVGSDALTNDLIDLH